MARIWVLPIIVLAAAAVLAEPASADPQGKGRNKGVGKGHGIISSQEIGKNGRRDVTTTGVIRRNKRDKDRAVRIIDGIFDNTGIFHGLPPGLGKRHDHLPHGLAKRGGHLPPGLAKQHGVPPGLANRSELPHGLTE